MTLTNLNELSLQSSLDGKTEKFSLLRHISLQLSLDQIQMEK